MADAYTAQGFVVDLAIHDDGLHRNPHVHLLMTTRIVRKEGSGLKVRSSDEKQFVSEARAQWERIANAALGEAGLAMTIDSRSYAKRKLMQMAGEHRGPDPEERRGNRIRARRQREQVSQRESSDDISVADPKGSTGGP